MKRIWIVFIKEMFDNLRDRRSIMSSLLTPVFMPVFLIAFIMVLGKAVIKDTVEAPLDLPVAGVEYAPDLIAYLRQNNANILPSPDDPQSAVREGDVNLVLIIHESYADSLSTGQPAALDLVMDNTRTSANADIQRARGLLSGYESTIATLRLQARGVSPSVLNVLAVKSIDMSTPESQALIFLNMMPFLLIMTIFLGGMNVIIDTTAGERERGSLEPFLINPVFRREFVIGKLFASLPFAFFTLALTLVLFWVGFNLVPLEEYTGFKLSIDRVVLWNIFWLCVPMILLASALQMVVASFTRSFKEAQTYLSFLPLFAGLPGAFLAFLPVKADLTSMLIPTYGQSILINQFMRGETVLAQNMMISTLATLVVSLILIVVAIRLYNREQILFGR